MTGESGTAIVLRMLRDAYARDPEEWTSTTSLLRESIRVLGGMIVHSRVADARRVLEREGLTIAHDVYTRASGKRIHAYRIVPVQTPDVPDVVDVDTPEPTLFGSDIGKGPTRWPRD